MNESELAVTGLLLQNKTGNGLPPAALHAGCKLIHSQYCIGTDIEFDREVVGAYSESIEEVIRKSNFVNCRRVETFGGETVERCMASHTVSSTYEKQVSERLHELCVEYGNIPVSNLICRANEGFLF